MLEILELVGWTIACAGVTISAALIGGTIGNAIATGAEMFAAYRQKKIESRHEANYYLVEGMKEVEKYLEAHSLTKEHNG